MKKFILLILTLVIGFTAESQTPQYWNRLPTTGANVFPFGINPATGKKVQWAIAAGEFNQPTPAPAGNITSIWFQPNSAGSTTFTTLTVKFATVSTSTFIPGIGQFYTGPMVTVLSQNTTMTAASALQWVSIPLTTPYPYDPTMNLIIEVSQCGYTGPGFAIFHDVVDVAPNYRRAYSDAASVCGVTVLPASGQFNVPAIGLNFSGAATGPTVTINQAAAQPDPTNVSPINFTAVFSAPVTGFTTGDVALSGTAGATTGTVTGGPTTYNVAVSGMTGSGTVIANIPAGVCIDATSNPNQASTSTDNTVTYNLPPPVACTTFVGTVSAADPTNGFRSFRDAVPSTCAVPGPCSAQIAGSFNYKILTWTNPVAAPQCVTVTYSTTSANFNFVTAFNGAVNLANLCTNYLGDPGSSAIPGTPIVWSFTAPASATINFYVANVVGGQTADYTIDVSAPTCSVAACTITRTSAVGTDNQTRCLGQSITNITYATTGATGATFSGLPPGVTGVWASNVATISGTPTAAGVFNYTVTLVGCAATTATGTITVSAPPTVGILEDPTGPLCAGDPKLLTAVSGLPIVSSCFTQSTSPTPVAGSVACNAGGITTDNSYWRVYPLTPYGLPGPLTINSVKFGIEQSLNGPYAVTVNLYKQTGAAFPGGTRTLIRTQVISVPNQNLTVFTAPITPITVNPTDVIVVELFTPGTATSSFFIGSNTAAQTGPSYISATACGIATPTDLAAIGFPNMHIILDFCGTTGGGGTPFPAGTTYLWSPAAGLSSTTTNPVAASPAVTTTYTVQVTPPAGCVGTGSILVTVYARPAITSQPSNVSLCAGGSASFSITATGQAITYQWQESTNGGVSYTNLVNAPPYSGVNTATLTINPTTFAMNGNRYRCNVSGACPPVATSNAAILTVVALPNVAVTPNGIICGGVAGLSGTLLTASGANTYVWSPLAGLYTNATSTVAYTGAPSTATVYASPTTYTVYTVTGTNTATGCSNTATVVVNATPPPPVVTPNPVAMCLGDPAVRLISSSAIPGSCITSSGPLNILITDANAANTQNFATLATMAVNCVPANATITCMSVTFSIPDHTFVGDELINLKAPNGTVLNLYHNLGSTAGINIPYPNAGISNLTISSCGVISLATANTASQTGPVTGTYRADLTNGLITPGYTLSDPPGYVSTATAWAQLFSVPNGTWTLAMTDDGAGDVGHLTNWAIKFDYIIGVQSTQATWSPATFLWLDQAQVIPYVAGTQHDTVWTRPTPAGVYTYNVTVNGINPPAIFTNPAPITINDNAAGTPYPSNVVVANLPTSGVTVKSVTLNGFNHTWSGDVDVVLQSPTGQNVILLGRLGNDAAVTATGVNLKFIDAAATAVPTTSPMASGTYKPTNYNASPFSFLAPGPQNIVTPVNPANPTLATFTGNMNGTWKLYVEDRVGGDFGTITGGYSIEFNDPTPPCTSPPRVVTVTVNTPIAITVQPVNHAVCTNGTTSFTATATGSNVTYQWQVSTDAGNTWTNIANNANYSGATTNTLTITNPPTSWNGYLYRVMVNGAVPCPSVPSNNVILTVNPLPTITIAAAPYRNLLPGLITSLFATSSPAAVTYQWFRNGVAVTGGTVNPLLVDINGLGTYSVRVTDVNGCTNTSGTVVIGDSTSGRVWIYPNPTGGQFGVRYNPSHNNVLPRGINIYDATGKRILTQAYTLGAPFAPMNVDLSNQGSGIYWVEVVDVDGNRLAMGRVDIVR